MDKVLKNKAEGYSRWALVNYFDVYEIEDEGWQVNNICTEFDDLWLSDDITPEEVIEYLHSTGWLTTSDMEAFEIEDNGDMIEIMDATNGQPLFGLRMIY